MSRKSIGVAIPCYKGHLGALPHLLDSIEKQTRKPERVAISCSSTEPSDVSLSLDSYSFPVELILHSDKKAAAENRNCAADHLTTDILTFMDADDIMHPQRLEVINTCFTKYTDVKILLHHYEMDATISLPHYENLDCFHFNRLFRCPHGSTQHADYLFQSVVHNGQPSVTRHVFDQIRFDESPHAYTREDTLFCTTVISMFPYQTAYCPYKLSTYVPSLTRGYLA
jgi:glycosyltransferase involved in cell wall biosynthesis